MEVCERYYRRSYNAINRLIEAYKNGYEIKNTLNFKKELESQFISNSKVAQSEYNNIIFTILIALLGLNKEAIENTGKITEYKKNNNELDLSKFEFTEDQKIRLKEFNNTKVISTDFDSWLSIKINPNTDKKNIDYLRRVRNSLLHSNFYIDESTPFMPFARLKTKSYYEAELLNTQFQMFIFEYFGNIDALGLSEELYTFYLPDNQIKDQESLIKTLLLTTINKISYKNLKKLGEESPELLLKESYDKDNKVELEKFIKKLQECNNAEDIKWERTSLNEQYIAYFLKYIEKEYGDSFYSFDFSKQSNIITTHLKYELNSKTEISNWLIHFWYLYATLNANFDISFFDGDEYGTESCYPALMILKSYLLMYRLQNNNFDEIDYNNINLDINDSDIKLYSENKDKTAVTEDYFKNSFDKEKNKGIITEDNLIWNKIICEVVRDSLAHGNIRTYTSVLTNKPMIELKDIDPKKGTTRVIVMPLSKYEIFLNSIAFNPSNCYKKNEEKLLTKKTL